MKRLVILGVMLALIPLVLVPVYSVMAPPASALMLLRAVAGNGMDYRWTPLDEISPRLVRAVTVSEDARFCEHNGVDWEVMRGLVEEALDEDGEPVRGGSTIAMQTAKNLLLWPQRSYVRKAIELPISLWIDLVWSKRRVMEVYLNIAEWGPGVYGAEAASQRHFGKQASQLSMREAALLAGALPNPYIYTAGKPGPKLRRRARRVQARMKGSGRLLGCLQQ
jgi:monofunctional biosynthetic peptidoglycan transglycosylase